MPGRPSCASTGRHTPSWGSWRRQPGSGERWGQDAPHDRRQVNRLGVRPAPWLRGLSALLILRCIPRQVDILAARV
jgi:hypothetical protein